MPSEARRRGARQRCRIARRHSGPDTERSGSVRIRTRYRDDCGSDLDAIRHGMESGLTPRAPRGPSSGMTRLWRPAPRRPPLSHGAPPPPSSSRNAASSGARRRVSGIHASPSMGRKYGDSLLNSAAIDAVFSRPRSELSKLSPHFRRRSSRTTQPFVAARFSTSAKAWIPDTSSFAALGRRSGMTKVKGDTAGPATPAHPASPPNAPVQPAMRCTLPAGPAMSPRIPRRRMAASTSARLSSSTRPEVSTWIEAWR